MTHTRDATPDSWWQGTQIRLRAVEPEDWPAFAAWDADDEASRRLYFVHFPQSQAALRQWVADLAARHPDRDDYFLLMENRAGLVVGSISTHDCDHRTGTWTYGVQVRHGFRQRGYAAEAIVLLARYMFGELRYQKCTVQVYDFNTPSIRLHERLGFQQEGRLRRMGFSAGKHFDILMFGLAAEEFAATHGMDSAGDS